MKPSRPYVNPFDEEPQDRGEGIALLAFIVVMLGLALLGVFCGGPAARNP